MTKIHHYEFDPDLILDKLMSPSSLTPVITDETQPINVLLTKRLPRPLRRVNSLNPYISSSDHVWSPLHVNFNNFITRYDAWRVYIENDTGQ